MTRPEGPAPVECDVSVRSDIPSGYRVVSAGVSTLDSPIIATFLGDILGLDVRFAMYQDLYISFVYEMCFSINVGSNNSADSSCCR